MDRDKIHKLITRLMEVEIELDTTAKELIEEKESITSNLYNEVGMYNPIETDEGTFEIVVNKMCDKDEFTLSVKMTNLLMNKMGKTENDINHYTSDQVIEITSRLISLLKTSTGGHNE